MRLLTHRRISKRRLSCVLSAHVISVIGSHEQWNRSTQMQRLLRRNNADRREYQPEPMRSSPMFSNGSSGRFIMIKKCFFWRKYVHVVPLPNPPHPSSFCRSENTSSFIYHLFYRFVCDKILLVRSNLADLIERRSGLFDIYFQHVYVWSPEKLLRAWCQIAAVFLCAYGSLKKRLYLKLLSKGCLFKNQINLVVF